MHINLSSFTRRTRLSWRFLPLAMIVAFLFAACGGGGTTTSSSPTATTQPTSAPTATATSQASSSVVTVKIVEKDEKYSFSPATLSIKAGTQVKWVNTTDTPHTVTSDTAGAFTSSSTLTQNQTFTNTFTSAGSFAYHCSIHPYMKATITVTS